MMKKKHISSGAPWEEIVGYSRVVRAGSHVFLSGTAAVDESGEVVAPGNGKKQMRYILQVARKALEEAGADLSCIVRTRMFVTDISQWESIGRVHREVFRDIRPATSMVEVNGLIAPGMVVEIEMDGIVTD
ncbi:MAG: RidA family protein [Cyclobacteriaceae bacterium]